MVLPTLAPRFAKVAKSRPVVIAEPEVDDFLQQLCVVDTHGFARSRQFFAIADVWVRVRLKHEDASIFV